MSYYRNFSSYIKYAINNKKSLSFRSWYLKMRTEFENDSKIFKFHAGYSRTIGIPLVLKIDISRKKILDYTHINTCKWKIKVILDLFEIDYKCIDDDGIYLDYQNGYIRQDVYKAVNFIAKKYPEVKQAILKHSDWFRYARYRRRKSHLNDFYGAIIKYPRSPKSFRKLINRKLAAEKRTEIKRTKMWHAENEFKKFEESNKPLLKNNILLLPKLKNVYPCIFLPDNDECSKIYAYCEHIITEAFFYNKDPTNLLMARPYSFGRRTKQVVSTLAKAFIIEQLKNSDFKNETIELCKQLQLEVIQQAFCDKENEYLHNSRTKI